MHSGNRFEGGAGSVCCVRGSDASLPLKEPLPAQEYKWVPVVCLDNLSEQKSTMWAIIPSILGRNSKQ